MNITELFDHHNHQQEEILSIMADLTQAVSDLIATVTETQALVAGLQSQLAAATDTTAEQAAADTIEAQVAELKALQPPPVVVPEALAVVPASVAGNVGVSLADTLVVSGGVAPYSFVSADLVNTGLAVDGAGNISGTPTLAGSYSVSVSDSSTPALDSVVVVVTIS